MSDRPLRFPPRKHVLTASIKLEDVPGVITRLRRELADLLRELAGKNAGPVGAALLEAADIFEERADSPPPQATHEPVLIGRKRQARDNENDAGGQ